MRPEVLTPLFANVATLHGIGPRIAQTLGKLVGRTNDDGTSADARVVDLIWHFAYSVIDRSHMPTVADAVPGSIATISVTVGRHQPSPRHNRRVPYRVQCHDETGDLTLVFFHAHADYLQKQLPVGETRLISGKVELFNDEVQMTHPDYILTREEFDDFPTVEPVYPMTAGIAAKTLRKAIASAIETCPELPEWQDEAWHGKQQWQTFHDALKQSHRPESLAEAQPDATARNRLAYDELLASQLALAIMRNDHKKTLGRSLTGPGRARDAVMAVLPYALTGSQTNAVADMVADMAAPERMLRLLQGDVGSGKTIVAVLALVNAVEAGVQGAFMAPTEILVRQHFSTIEPLCRAAGVNIALLTGREKGAARKRILEGLLDGSIDVLVGTHALFQQQVAFRDLGFAVIDEQHRFGVHQRLALQSKSNRGVDMLVMTATPIPRTLSLTLYGDMESSVLTEKPAGRIPVDTRVLPIERVGDVEKRLETTLQSGNRCYWVCPLVSESDVLDLTDVEQRYAGLSKRFPGRVGLLHGQMKPSDKDACMARFQAGEIDILVATTVIEVGVDVPEASIMIIEHAERFGLAQLHQLRGRVGRGTAKSTCLLLYQQPLGEVARARLEIMRETEDGFRIAEEDLRLRGAGELLGTRQSGTPGFRIADLAVHAQYLAAARDDASLIMRQDPLLVSPRGEALRILLHLFERQSAVKLLAAG
jgi:ATP-dependent DNA helicase RecG